MPVRALLLDLDDTIYEYEVCNMHATEKVVAMISKRYKIGKEKAQQVYSLAREDVKRHTATQGASHSRLLYLKRATEIICKKTEVEFSLRLEHEFWKEYFKHMKIRGGVKDALRFCRDKNIKTAIVSNFTVGVQLEKLTRLGIAQMVDFVFTSEESGKEKPDPALIGLALERMGVEMKDAVFAGDEEDVKAAQRAGIAFHLANSRAGWEGLLGVLGRQ